MSCFFVQHFSFYFYFLQLFPFTFYFPWLKFPRCLPLLIYDYMCKIFCEKCDALWKFGFLTSWLSWSLNLASDSEFCDCHSPRSQLPKAAAWNRTNSYQKITNQLKRNLSDICPCSSSRGGIGAPGHWSIKQRQLESSVMDTNNVKITIWVPGRYFWVPGH